MKALVVASLVVLLGASVLTQDRHGTFIRVQRDITGSVAEFIWLNTLHMHSIQPCTSGNVSPYYACVHMDDDGGNRARIFRTEKLYEPAVRDILDLPNPTTPTAVVSAPDAALVGEEVALSVAVTDPDYGDTWTYEWSESDATMRGGTFSEPSASETAYTPAADGTVVVQVRVTDDAGQSVVAAHPINVTEP